MHDRFIGVTFHFNKTVQISVFDLDELKQTKRDCVKKNLLAPNPK